MVWRVRAGRPGCGSCGTKAGFPVKIGAGATASVADFQPRPPTAKKENQLGSAAIVVESVRKSYGSIQALDGVDLIIEEGTVFGLLGPNGAGKTTLVRVLTTLLKPDSGRAVVLGCDTVRDAVALRSRIGLAGQYAAVDQTLTGYENLEMVGRLYNLGASEARRRADDLLERIDLEEAAHRPVRTYSGGMQRRLDLAAGLVGRPEVLVMDEPTTGLDPRSRLELWKIMEEMVTEGATLLLTTQYLEEADRLASRVAVIDAGRLISEGTPDELKSQMHGDVLEMTIVEAGEVERAAEILGRHGRSLEVDRAAQQVRMTVAGTSQALSALRDIDESGVGISDLQLRHPSLDDVFLALTGRTAESGDGEADRKRDSGRRGIWSIMPGGRRGGRGR